MATSGSINFTQTRNEIINDAYQLLGIYGVGRTISDEDQTFAERMLNKMVKAWQAKGIHLWAKEEAYLFVADNIGEYTLSNASASARATSRSDAVITEIKGGHASSSTTIVVDDTTGMAASDIFGVVQSDDTVHWTTITTVDSSTQVTITDATTASAADNTNVYTFTSRINKPLRIHSVRRINGIGTSVSAIPLVELSHEEFFNLPNKNLNSANPSHFYYSPDLSDGTLYLWPRPSDPEVYFAFTYDRMLEDFDASTDNADFPTEWLEVLTWQLAVRLAPAFGKGQMAIQQIEPKAISMLQDMMAWDNETVSVYIQPGYVR